MGRTTKIQQWHLKEGLCIGVVSSTQHTCEYPGTMSEFKKGPLEQC